VAGLLGEMIGAPVDEEEASDALRAARQDPMLLAEQLTVAFVDWLRAETARASVLFLIEDLHWGDRPSIHLLDAALRALPDAPMLLLVLTRPEVHEVFPQLFSGREPDEIRLEPLSRKASIELAREVLGERASLPRLEAIAERAGGNALYLEELIRAVAEGTDAELPDTVIGMVQARLETLGPDARRLLRAASVFGEVFPEGGVRALAGGGGSGYDLREWLDDLARRELISALPVAPGDQGGRVFRFRHALVRDGAYATFPDDDRALAHRLACLWLEENGERDALTMASHAERGGDDERAVRWLRRAAEQALEGNDLPAVVAAGERALARGVEGQDRGAILALVAIAAYWQSRYREGSSWGTQASEILPPSGPLWFSAAGSALVSMARLGEFSGFDKLFDELRGAHAAPGAEAAQLIALCRGTFQLIFKGRFDDADATLARIAEIAAAAGELDALTRAQSSHVRGVRSAMVGDVGPFLVNLEIAVDFFERAGDLRNVSLERSTVGWCYVEIGQVDHAIRLLRASLARCLELRSQQAITYAKANLGYALACAPAHHDEARAVLAQAIEETRAVANRRLEGWSRGYLVPVLRAAGDHEAEEREASLACELLSGAPGLLAWTLAQRARALLALGRPGEALPLAREAMALLERLGGLLQGESLPPLTLAECLDACGEREAAREAARDALRRLQRRAARLPHEAWRATFLAIEDNLLTAALARRMGV
jgi:tetratricopeptide (TPR) repeat protein